MSQILLVFQNECIKINVATVVIVDYKILLT